MLEQHSIATSLATLEASPMSRKRAMLLVLLIDAAIDATRPAKLDVLAHRQSVANASPALALVMEIAAMREGGPRLVVQAVDAPPRSEAEYMISVYNDAMVPRLMIVSDTVMTEALPVLRQAVAALAGT